PRERAGGEPDTGCHWRAVYRHFHISARKAYFENTLLGVYRSCRTSDFFDLLGVYSDASGLRNQRAGQNKQTSYRKGRDAASHGAESPFRFNTASELLMGADSIEIKAVPRW